MQTIKKAALVLVGIALGCGGAAVAPMTVSSAQTPGQWACYRTSEFPSTRMHEDFTKGMNAVAPKAGTGSVITMPGNVSDDTVVCVKN